VRESTVLERHRERDTVREHSDKERQAERHSEGDAVGESAVREKDSEREHREREHNTASETQ
jgi:hypothetical protein